MSKRNEFLAITIAVILATAIGLFFVFQQSDIEQQAGNRKQTAFVESSSITRAPKEEQKEGGTSVVQAKTLPEHLNLQWPEEIPVPYNPCANLQVPSHVKQARTSLIEQKENAENIKEEILAKHELPKEIFRGDPNRKAVALTIDTGVGGAEGIEQILKLGRHYGISFTFFLTGCWMLENSELTQQIAQEGHSIANHTLTHVNLGKVSDEQARREIGETHRIVGEMIGWKPVLFRKPQYAGGQRIVELLAEYGMISVQGSPDLGDTTGWRAGTTREDVVRLVKRKTDPGAVWVLHNLSLADLGALEEIIRFHLEKGYEIVSVEEMI